MLSYRRFDKESDYDIMRDIVQQNCIRTGHLYPQLHIGNLDFERFSFEETPDTLYQTNWFVYEDKTAIGFFTVVEDEYYIILDEEFKQHIAVVIDYIQQNCYAEGTTFTTDANSEDRHLSASLEQKGYTKTGKHRFNGFCCLSTIPVPTAMPEGYSIRLTEKTDAARRAELYGLATGGIGTSPERYLKMMEAPSYSDALDLVVQSAAGEIIAYCTLWDDPVSRIGILEPLACVAEHRRKGIMKSLLLHGMNLLKERGTRYMYVGTGGSNAASQALYKSVGFVEHGINAEWQKNIIGELQNE